MLFTAVSSAVYKVSSCTLSYNYEIRIPNLDIVMMLNYITTLICMVYQQFTESADVHNACYRASNYTNLL